MPRLTLARLNAYRAQTYRLKPARRVKTIDEALAFVEARGFVYFWPIKGVELPSLWAAVAGDRPVADEHDDPGHITWGWKDQWLGARRWYYAKLLRGKATLVALPVVPYFYALSENFGDWRADYLELFAAGRLTADARAVYEALLEKGPLHTLALRKEARLTSKGSNARFEKALVELQTGLRILPVGVAQAGAWRYAFIYDIVDRHFPDLAAQAGSITRVDARAHLAGLYLDSVGAARAQDAQRLFRWTVEETRRVWERLADEGRALRLEAVAGVPGEWLATPRLFGAGGDHGQ